MSPAGQFAEESRGAGGRYQPHYKGGSAFNLVNAGPNVARCGAFPQNIELTFEGSGIDTEGGYNTAVFSACTNTTTNEVFDLRATDTYAQTGDQVFIEGDSFVLAPNPAICAPRTPGVPFRIAVCTGSRERDGHGFQHSVTDAGNGQVLPSPSRSRVYQV